MNKIYSKYFQKSRAFLYPALGIKKNSNISPSGTYVTLPEMIQPKDMKLICTFNNDASKEFKIFEKEMLLGNPLFETKYESNNYTIYVFNLETYKDDFTNFLSSKYSKFSNVLKKAIKSYYGELSKEYKLIDTYLNPDKYFTLYAESLDIDVNMLKEVGELCDKLNLNKETLNISVQELKISK